MLRVSTLSSVFFRSLLQQNTRKLLLYLDEILYIRIAWTDVESFVTQ